VPLLFEREFSKKKIDCASRAGQGVKEEPFSLRSPPPLKTLDGGILVWKVRL
jgi:hypothetical protein